MAGERSSQTVPEGARGTPAYEQYSEDKRSSLVPEGHPHRSRETVPFVAPFPGTEGSVLDDFCRVYHSRQQKSSAVDPKSGDVENVCYTQAHSFETGFPTDEIDELVKSVRVPVFEVGTANAHRARPPPHSVVADGTPEAPESAGGSSEG